MNNILKKIENIVTSIHILSLPIILGLWSIGVLIKSIKTEQYEYIGLSAIAGIIACVLLTDIKKK